MSSKTALQRKKRRKKLVQALDFFSHHVRNLPLLKNYSVKNQCILMGQPALVMQTRTLLILPVMRRLLACRTQESFRVGSPCSGCCCRSASAGGSCSACSSASSLCGSRMSSGPSGCRGNEPAEACSGTSCQMD